MGVTFSLSSRCRLRLRIILTFVFLALARRLVWLICDAHAQAQLARCIAQLLVHLIVALWNRLGLMGVTFSLSSRCRLRLRIILTFVFLALARRLVWLVCDAHAQAQLA